MMRVTVWFPRIGLATVVAALLCVVVPAFAGEPSDKGPQAPTSTASERADEEASTRFRRGLERFEEGDYTLALVEFERAYQLAPNYKALYNIALVNMQLGRYAAAYHAFSRYLHDGGTNISEARRREVQRSLDSLTLRTATVELSTNVAAAEVSLDGKTVDPAQLGGPMLLDAGEHVLRGTAPGYAPATRTVVLAGADHATVRLILALLAPAHPLSPTTEGPARTLFWPGFVATGALAAGAIVGGAVTLDARSSLSNLQNTPGSNPTERANDANRANVASVISDVCTGLAIVVGGVSIYLSLRPSSSPVRASVGIGPGHVSFAGTF
ncbi:MAG: hypothetical protein ABTD50_09275 [Polyangiaceae bacterium]|jgi:hypothetical protein